jgi:hypothetical protein
MNHTLELWKDVPGAFEEVSVSSQSKSSSRGKKFSDFKLFFVLPKHLLF